MDNVFLKLVDINCKESELISFITSSLSIPIVSADSECGRVPSYEVTSRTSSVAFSPESLTVALEPANHWCTSLVQNWDYWDYHTCLMYSGWSFHNLGVATENALSPLSFWLDLITFKQLINWPETPSPSVRMEMLRKVRRGETGVTGGLFIVNAWVKTLKLKVPLVPLNTSPCPSIWEPLG